MTTLLYRRIPINKCKKNKGKLKSLLECHSNNYCSQGLPKDAKINGWEFKHKQIKLNVLMKKNMNHMIINNFKELISNFRKQCF